MTKKTNGQNGAATSANVNSNGYYSVDVLANRAAKRVVKKVSENVNVFGEHRTIYSMTYDEGKRIKVVGIVKITEGYYTFYNADDAKYAYEYNVIREEKRGRKYVEVEGMAVSAENLSYEEMQTRLYNDINKKFILLANDEVEDDEVDEENRIKEFLRENMPIIPVDIIKESIAEVLDDEETFYRLFWGSYRCAFNDFTNIVWGKTWEKVLDAQMSDEALEDQTREWMEFEDRVRYILESDGSDKYEFVVNYNDELCFSEREENEVEEQTEENEVEFEDGNYIVIAHTADGDIIIGKDGKNYYDDFETALAVKRDHDNMGAEVVVYIVQKTMNEYGVVSDEFIRCTEVEEENEVELEDMSEDYFKRREEQRNLAI